MFDLQSNYSPSGDQPKAINDILETFHSGKKNVTLLGATGTGKTFTMANIIQQMQKPTLVISHNKTLAAQLSTEFKYFFPNNAVHYFVSYFDYYQPEAYLPAKDMYIETESTINKEIEMFRLGAMASLLTRKDTIIVSSVSALYGLGSKEAFQENVLFFEVGKRYAFGDIKKSLIKMQYKPVQAKIEPGMFDIKGEIIDIFSSVDKLIYRLIFDEDVLEVIQQKDSLTFKDLGLLNKAAIWPANQFLQDMNNLDAIINSIQEEMEERVAYYKSLGNDMEASRIQKRTTYDLRMMKETGFVKGIENYSLYFDGRIPGEPPNTIFDYFPDDMLVIIDESHMSLPQLRAMPAGDRSRKLNLIEHGFRLPSAIDHRPLNYRELETILGWNDNSKVELDAEDELDMSIKSALLDIDRTQHVSQSVLQKVKSGAQTLFVSATPAEYELKLSDKIIEQIIRPTGLLDPITYVYPKGGDYEYLKKNIDELLKKKPYLQKYFDGYDQEIDLRELFFGK